MIEISDSQFKRFRFPPTIIRYAVWLYYVFPLSFRDIELLLVERLIEVSHETIRKWCYRFGSFFAKQVRQQRRRPTDKWHLDEVFVKINGKRHYFRPKKHKLTAQAYRSQLSIRFAGWAEIAA